MMEKPTKRPSFLTRHSAAFLVLSSQIVAALMHALARIVETGSGLQERVHPFTVLQVRLFITVSGCSFFLWRSRISFLGSPELRPLLASRAAGGVFGACGFYSKIVHPSMLEHNSSSNKYSVDFIPLSERSYGSQFHSANWRYYVNKVLGRQQSCVPRCNSLYYSTFRRCLSSTTY
jgi:hypothetical protein